MIWMKKVEKNSLKLTWSWIKLSSKCSLQMSRDLSCNPRQNWGSSTEFQGLILKNFSGFYSQYVYQHLVRKKLFNYYFHFEAISIYLCPFLKRSPCKWYFEKMTCPTWSRRICLFDRNESKCSHAWHTKAFET